MKNTFGNSLTLTLFGESHGSAIGCVIDGIAPGIPIDEAMIAAKLAKRRPDGETSTARIENDEYIIQSGIFQGHTTGTPICIVIPNENTRSGDYSYGKARPSHADYPAYMKYHGFEDYRGGGHFSGRITAALVAAGAIFEGALKEKGIRIGTHLVRCACICDRGFDMNSPQSDISYLESLAFPVLSESAAERMKKEILLAKARTDSVGGVLETVVTGIEAGIGEPWFDTVESLLSHALFSIPAVKGVEFGDGFALADMRASFANDWYKTDGSGITTTTNHNGGICGGITNGSPLLFRCAVKPTPSIAIKQKTVDFIEKINTDIEIGGRHDPCIAPRAACVVNAVTALVIADMLTTHFGTDYLKPEGKEKTWSTD